jgi:hypothetical protein
MTYIDAFVSHPITHILALGIGVAFGLIVSYGFLGLIGMDGPDDHTKP